VKSSINQSSSELPLYDDDELELVLSKDCVRRTGLRSHEKIPQQQRIDLHPLMCMPLINSTIEAAKAVTNALMSQSVVFSIAAYIGTFFYL